MEKKTKTLLIILVFVFGITACANKGEIKQPLIIDSDVSVFEIPGDIRPLSGEIVIRRGPYFQKGWITTASNFILIQDKSQYSSNYRSSLMEIEFRMPDENSHEINATVTTMFEKSNTEATKSWTGRIYMQVAWNPNSGVITKKSIDGGVVPEDKQELFDDMLEGLKKSVKQGRYFDVPISKLNREFFYKEKAKIGSISFEFVINEKILGETIYRDVPALVAEYSGSIKILSGLIDAKGIRVVSKKNGASLYDKSFMTGVFKEEFGDIQFDQSTIFKSIEYQPL